MFRNIATAFAVFLLATPVGATVLELDVAGAFENGISRGGDTVASDGGSIDWGQVSSGTFNSAYFFEGESRSTDSMGDFLLGTVTHRNGSIWRTPGTLVGVDLAIDISGTVAGKAFEWNDTMTFDHRETLNRGTCASGFGRCNKDVADIVDISAFDPFEFVVKTDKGTYTLTLAAGPAFTVEGEVVDNFSTEEREFTELLLWGSLAFDPSDTDPGIDPGPDPEPVPLPAGGMLLLAALGGLGLIRRRSS